MLVIVVFCLFKLGIRINHYWELKDQVDIYTAQLEEVKAEYDEKLQTVTLLENDAYLERVARENLGMVKTGETVVSAVKTETSAEENVQNIETEVEE